MTTIPSHTEVFRNVNIVVVQEVQSMSTLLLFRKCVNVNIAVVQEVQSMSTLLLFKKCVNVNIAVVQFSQQFSSTMELQCS